LGSIVRPIEGWQWIVTLWYVTKWNFSWFKVIERCHGFVDPAETWWHGLIPKEFILQRPPLDSIGILRSLHERLMIKSASDVPYYHNCLWAYSTSSWSIEFSSQMCKCETSRILLYICVCVCVCVSVCVCVCVYICLTITSVCGFHSRIPT